MGLSCTPALSHSITPGNFDWEYLLSEGEYIDSYFPALKVPL